MSKFFKSKKGNLSVTPKNQEPRPIETVQAEYMQAATDLGNIEYQIKSFEVRKGSIISKMAELSLEASLIKSEEQKPVEGEATDGNTEG